MQRSCVPIHGKGIDMNLEVFSKTLGNKACLAFKKILIVIVSDAMKNAPLSLEFFRSCF